MTPFLKTYRYIRLKLTWFDLVDIVIVLNLLIFSLHNFSLHNALQTFDVQLIRVTSGGASIGPDRAVRIGIIRNDSPNGVFSFENIQVLQLYLLLFKW